MSTAPASPSASTAAPAASSLVDDIGRTPLLRLDRVADDLPDSVAVYGKAEHLNPGGSVKDRPALRMIEAGLDAGAFRPEQTLIDATSGNTGIAYAMIGAAKGLDVALALPENASAERKKVLRAYGAELILTDPMAGTDGAQRRVKEIVDAHPDRYFYPDQYNNDANWRAHYDGTGTEILDQTDGAVSHFVTGLGTTGTFTGVTRRLKAHDASIRCVAVEPETALHGLEGLKHMETAIVPGIYAPDLADAHHTCSTEAAVDMTRRLAREEGLLVGPSAGANVAAALDVARSLDAGTVVTILCDTGTRYLSDDFWEGES
ncbi:PLP-dependent cysteine synthase family protein [Salinibacter ruber]|uniref:PLP-dependent cysteine synthase family protein n=1 Tax=Salinibacter ruber TaxID=146919 RepID=UPI000E571FEF|nr:cysteine synthase family protein [Salinibacter ruber]MCS3637333.1 cysteine synthase B [Salinibacter ruber]MCS3701340.1 cysteine synthase B [Salinibacter ruber]MCS3754241.1 cysteine synthase B [Salinibacter ruber]MCS4097285.1 cysteine synthase B [Salinibacter ruber]MCS4146619.1 cysteine synthase B [Salinibacter ruber]